MVQRYADVAGLSPLIGCLALFVAALYVAGLTAAARRVLKAVLMALRRR